MPKYVVYIIEDVADPTIVDQLKDYDCEIKRVGNRYDDCLIIVKHKK